jgi:hypothetical protein
MVRWHHGRLPARSEGFSENQAARRAIGPEVVGLQDPEFGYAQSALQALLCPWSETNLIRAGDTESKPRLRARRVSLQLTEMRTE